MDASYMYVDLVLCTTVRVFLYVPTYTCKQNTFITYEYKFMATIQLFKTIVQSFP